MRPRLCAAFLDALAPIVGPHPKANPMTFLSAHEIELYAVNTGALYETHKRLGRAITTTSQTWADHIRTMVLPAYRREIGRSATATKAEVAQAAEALRSYYRQHSAECARCQIEDDMARFSGFMRDTDAQRAHVKAYGLVNLDAGTRRALAQVVRADVERHAALPAQFSAAGDTDSATALEDELAHARNLLEVLPADPTRRPQVGPFWAPIFSPLRKFPRRECAATVRNAMKRTFLVTLELDNDAPLYPDFDRGVVIADMGAESLYDRLNDLFDGTFRGAHVSAVREEPEAAEAALQAPKHSPAPWWHDKDACAIRYRLPAGHPDRYFDDPELDDGARNVVSLLGTCGGIDTAADVALMTAAPEMLAALQHARSHFYAMGGEIPHEADRAVVAEIETAIAKAEGRA